MVLPWPALSDGAEVAEACKGGGFGVCGQYLIIIIIVIVIVIIMIIIIIIIVIIIIIIIKKKIIIIIINKAITSIMYLKLLVIFTLER